MLTKSIISKSQTFEKKKPVFWKCFSYKSFNFTTGAEKMYSSTFNATDPIDFGWKKWYRQWRKTITQAAAF